MDMIVFSMAALAALVPPSSSALPSAFGSGSNHAFSSFARRSPGGAVASATILVRIISHSARIGAGQAPLPDMAPRVATLAAADGSPVPALIYDFE